LREDALPWYLAVIYPAPNSEEAMAEGKRTGLITKKDVEGLKPGQTIWDAGIKGVLGFGARRQVGATVSFILAYRNSDGRQRRYTIGKFTALSVEVARDRAKKLRERIGRGEDPAETKAEQLHGQTVAEMLGTYITDCRAGHVLIRRTGKPKRASTIDCDASRVEAHIKRSALGKLRASSVGRKDIQDFVRWVTEGSPSKNRSKRSRAKGGRGAASRTLATLSAAFNYCRPDDPNPCRGVVRPAKGKRERRLVDAEYYQLGKALDVARETEWPVLSDLVQFLALSGWRAGEACSLRWEHININAHLATIETKTGISRRPLSKHAVDLLKARRQSPTVSGYVFPTLDGIPLQRLCSGKKGIWSRLVGPLWGDADTPVGERVTAHTLRHTFISLGIELGFTLSTVGAIVGHAHPGEDRESRVTAGYVHVVDPVLLAAVDEISGRIAALMAGSNVVPLEGRRHRSELRESA
jgi:integrase